MIYGIFHTLIIHLQKDDRLFKKHDRIFKKGDRVLKKRGRPSNPMSGCRKIQSVQEDYTPQASTIQPINEQMYKMQVFLANP